MNRHKFLVLNKRAEVYNSFDDIDSVCGFLLRTGYLNNKTVIVIKGDKAGVIEVITDVLVLQKQIQKILETL
jgi:hypothetical protein